MSTQNKRSILGDGANCEGKPAAWYNTITVEFRCEDAVNGTDEDNSLGVVPINFLVPDDYVATLHVTQFTVDDWGRLDIYPKGHKDNKLLHLGLEKDIDGAPGDRGGHVEWGKTGKVQLFPGEYVIEVSQTNATYNSNGDPRYNVSKCNLLIEATKSPTCIINWPTENVPFPAPIDWYERIIGKDDASPTGFKAYKWNWGTISGLTPSQFKDIAKGIYAESTPAELIRFEGNNSDSPRALAQETAFNEIKAIASVMMNRIGNSEKGKYRADSVVTDITAQFGTPKFPFTDNAAYREDMADDQYIHKPGPVCKKLHLCVDALNFVLSNGAPYPYDSYVTSGAETLPADAYDTIGNIKFRKEALYLDCRTKPVAPQPNVAGGWDDWDIAPSGPRGSNR